MTGDLHSEAGEPLVNVTFFAKLWVGLNVKGRLATVQISSLLLHCSEYMCTYTSTALHSLARFLFLFLFSYFFFKAKSHKQISSRDNFICGSQTGLRVHNSFLCCVHF